MVFIMVALPEGEFRFAVVDNFQVTCSAGRITRAGTIYCRGQNFIGVTMPALFRHPQTFHRARCEKPIRYFRNARGAGRLGIRNAAAILIPLFYGTTTITAISLVDLWTAI